MLGSDRIEARIIDTNNVLVALSPLADPRLASYFLGPVLTAEAPSAPLPSLAGRTVYLCGDVSRAGALPLGDTARVLVIKEHSRGYQDTVQAEHKFHPSGSSIIGEQLGRKKGFVAKKGGAYLRVNVSL